MDRIRLNASEWMDFRSGEKKCFLLTNGLGGYCSLTVMGNAARNDQALWDYEVEDRKSTRLNSSHP